MERLIDFVILGLCIFACCIYKFKEIGYAINEMFPNPIQYALNVKFILVIILFLFIYAIYKLWYRILNKKIILIKNLVRKQIGILCDQ